MSNLLAAHDSARVMPVKLGYIVDPRNIWAYPLYGNTKGQLSKIILLERKLGEMSDAEAVTEDTAVGSPVAIRRKACSDVWHRGRLEQLSMYGRQLVATVFLVDYGEVVENVKAGTCLRLMTAQFTKEPPMAFQILLSGLAPVSMNFDFNLDMVATSEDTREWDQAAWKMVRKEVQKVHNLAELRNWVVDMKGRYHGEVFLAGKASAQVHLNQLLIKNNFAVYSQWQIEKDMDEAENLEDNCNVLYTSVDFVTKKLDDWDVMEARNSSRSIRCGSGDSLEMTQCNSSPSLEMAQCNSSPKSLASCEGGFLRSAGRGRGLVEIGKLQGEDVFGVKEAFQNEQQSLGKNESNIGLEVRNRVEKANEFLEKLRKKKTQGNDVSGEDIWAALRSQGSSKSDGKSTHLLPAGVFIGKYHENVLANIQAANKMDQKKKFEDFVASGSNK